ncbi:MAG: T9SS type A sorting domain-containing protein [Reichenbachiella sp.]|uniref:T9SS type A sorting domain-containing protein n=1 Tax=Reichenbachiella sp. TaxID=2184521 RepID=UPI002966423C|nr:T9SS type A sorting domain-containing protein [Reichenbachiella sp.]MDW3212037.1 T9SS type A sorting domain-containing protein [Reichenbachiella sp.]
MKSIFTFLFVLISAVLSAQSGKMVLVGGGSESDASYSWSNKPYQWAIDESTNKKVAIISYEQGSTSDWLPDYFESLGAADAANFEIYSSALADAQDTYDDLMAYDVFFFKGGDQYEYYDLYQNSKVSQAIEDKFADGGVIMGTSAGMAILSKVFYSAEKSSLYPDEALSNVNSDNITLENDFLDVLDGVIVDTHFAERGRFPRLLAFMGHWKLNKDETVAGIGVDDKTALCIDENLEAVAYGTGAVSIYQSSNFTTDGDKPVANDIEVTHLLHEMSYDLESMEILGTYDANTSAIKSTENLKSTLYLSGSDALSHNEDLLDQLIASTPESVVLISRSGSSLINSYESYFEANSDLDVITVETVLADECDGVATRNQIREAETMVVVDLDIETFSDYFENDLTGQLLLEKMKRSDSQIAFIGYSSALVGAYYCTNNEVDELNAYYGELAYESGLGILETTIIMPNTYDPSTSTYYENNTSAVLHGMVSQRLGYGIYLNERSYVTISQNEGDNELTSTGSYASILIKNNSSLGDQADQQVNSSGDARNAVGFDEMTYYLVSGQQIVIGTTDESADPVLAKELESPFDVKAEWQDNVVGVSWSLPEQEADELNIYRKMAAEEFELLASLDDTKTVYDDANVSEGTTYTYAVEVKNGNSTSCLSESAAAEIVLLASSLEDSWKIYPNPVTHGILNISHANQLKVSILDLSGKVLLDSQRWFPNRKLDLSFLPSGPYLLKLHEGEDFQIHKIIVDHE